MFAFLLVSVFIVGAVYWYSICTYTYWKKRRVPHPEPHPFVGNMLDNILLRKMLGQIYTDIYNKYPSLRYVGYYKFRQPAVLLRDPELIKDVLVKNFSSFQDNDINIDENVDLYMGRNPFNLKGDRWKTSRSRVTPQLTAAKIKTIFPLMVEVTKQLQNYLDSEYALGRLNEVEAKELTAKFTTNIVATCAFGLDGNSFTDPNSQFRAMGREMLEPNVWVGLQHMLIILAPSLANMLKIKFIPTKVANWFKDIITQSVSYRIENNIIRNDYLDSLIGLRNKLGSENFTDVDITVYAMTFFLDGFETSSTCFSFILYELAASPDIQKKLQEEIDTVLAKYNGEITYDAIQEMTYLDKAFNEGLRKYPPATAMSRVCTEKYTYPPAAPGLPEVVIEPGTTVLIPIHALQLDEQYFPNPEKYDPERFSEEEKQKRPTHCYLPFGDGPRICLGIRVALAQVKAGLVAILSKYEVRVNPKTIQPLEPDPRYFLLAAKGGIWLKFLKRMNK